LFLETLVPGLFAQGKGSSNKETKAFPNRSDATHSADPRFQAVGKLENTLRSCRGFAANGLDGGTSPFHQREYVCTYNAENGVLLFPELFQEKLGGPRAIRRICTVKEFIKEHEANPLRRVSHAAENGGGEIDLRFEHGENTRSISELESRGNPANPGHRGGLCRSITVGMAEQNRLENRPEKRGFPSSIGTGYHGMGRFSGGELDRGGNTIFQRNILSLFEFQSIYGGILVERNGVQGFPARESPEDFEPGCSSKSELKAFRLIVEKTEGAANILLLELLQSSDGSGKSRGCSWATIHNGPEMCSECNGKGPHPLNDSIRCVQVHGRFDWLIHTLNKGESEKEKLGDRFGSPDRRECWNSLLGESHRRNGEVSGPEMLENGGVLVCGNGEGIDELEENIGEKPGNDRKEDCHCGDHPDFKDAEGCDEPRNMIEALEPGPLKSELPERILLEFLLVFGALFEKGCYLFFNGSDCCEMGIESFD